MGVGYAPGAASAGPGTRVVPELTQTLQAKQAEPYHACRGGAEGAPCKIPKLNSRC